MILAGIIFWEQWAFGVFVVLILASELALHLIMPCLCRITFCLFDKIQTEMTSGHLAAPCTRCFQELLLSKMQVNGLYFKEL